MKRPEVLIYYDEVGAGYLAVLVAYWVVSEPNIQVGTVSLSLSECQFMVLDAGTQKVYWTNEFDDNDGLWTSDGWCQSVCVCAFLRVYLSTFIPPHNQLWPVGLQIVEVYITIVWSSVIRYPKTDQVPGVFIRWQWKRFAAFHRFTGGGTERPIVFSPPHPSPSSGISSHHKNVPVPCLCPGIAFSGEKVGRSEGLERRCKSVGTFCSFYFFSFCSL